MPSCLTNSLPEGYPIFIYLIYLSCYISIQNLCFSSRLFPILACTAVCFTIAIATGTHRPDFKTPLKRAMPATTTVESWDRKHGSGIAGPFLSALAMVILSLGILVGHSGTIQRVSTVVALSSSRIRPQSCFMDTGTCIHVIDYPPYLWCSGLD